MKPLFIATLLGITLFSCKEEHILPPEVIIAPTREIKIEHDSTLQQYIAMCYDALPDYSNWNWQGLQRAHIAEISDESVNMYISTPMYNVINKGLWYNNPSFSEIGWSNNYVGTNRGLPIPNSFFAISITNNIIYQADSFNFVTEPEKKLILGEAYFLRAFYYFEIIKRWGGMPKFDEICDIWEIYTHERLTYGQSTDWLIENLNKAIELLPDNWSADKLGKPTKLAAMALKEMAELYASSPLMNNEIGSTEDNGYNLARSKSAAQYAYNALHYIETTMPRKKMQGEGLSGAARDSAYKHIFYHAANTASDESIWFCNRSSTSREVDMRIHFIPQKFSRINSSYTIPTTCPTQNLVEKFETINPANGLAYPIKHSNSGFNSQNPFINRDPRFYNNILQPAVSHGNDNNNTPLFYEIWYGGWDYMHTSMSNGVEPTSYLCIKWWWPEANGFFRSEYTKYYYNCIFIRTTQLYLDYAEAMNEAYGPNSDPQSYGMTAVQAINRVRARVGMPGVLPEFTSSKELFRDRIRNERAVELMFENHRWWDLRRWMIAEKVFNPTDGSAPIKGLRLTDLTPDIKNIPDKSFNYQKFDILNSVRVFEKKHYWYPIPIIDSIPEALTYKQNQGW